MPAAVDVFFNFMIKTVECGGLVPSIGRCIVIAYGGKTQSWVRPHGY